MTRFCGRSPGIAVGLCSGASRGIGNLEREPSLQTKASAQRAGRCDEATQAVRRRDRMFSPFADLAT